MSMIFQICFCVAAIASKKKKKKKKKKKIERERQRERERRRDREREEKRRKRRLQNTTAREERTRTSFFCHLHVSTLSLQPLLLFLLGHFDLSQGSLAILLMQAKMKMKVVVRSSSSLSRARTLSSSSYSHGGRAATWSRELARRSARPAVLVRADGSTDTSETETETSKVEVETKRMQNVAETTAFEGTGGETAEAEPQEKTQADWFEETRRAAEVQQRPKSKTIDRPDLYSNNWDGDQYTGDGLNMLTVLIGLSIGVPVVGLTFAYFTFGVLWGLDT